MMTEWQTSRLVKYLDSNLENILIQDIFVYISLEKGELDVGEVSLKLNP